MMKTLAVFATLATVAFAQTTLTLNTPSSLVVCEPSQLTWTDDGKGPFFLSILPGNQPSAAPLKQFPPITGTSVTWLVDIAAGTSITGALKDQTGQTVFTSAITIQSGSNSSCVNTNVQEGSSAGSSSGSSSPSSGSSSPSSSGSAASSPSSAPATGASSTPAGSSPSSSGSTAPKSSGSSSPSSSGASPSQSGSSNTNKNGASRGTVSVGAFALTGLMGLVGAALF